MRIRTLFAIGVAGVILASAGYAHAATTSAGLKASPLANRLEARPLSGLSLDATSYLFLSGVSASSVSFYVDGATTPVTVEKTAPFDFSGTAADGSELPFDTHAWTNGRHSLKAVAITSSGTKTFTAKFSVMNRDGKSKPTTTTTVKSTTTTAAKPATTTTTTNVPETTSTTTVPATTTTTTQPVGSTSSGASCDIPFAQKYPGALPMPAVSVPAGFPSAANTGLNGVGLNKCDLHTYDGPHTITVDNTVIDQKHVVGSLTIEASNVVIKDSWIDEGSVTAGLYSGPNPAWSFTIEDSLVDAGYTDQVAVAEDNVTVVRSEIKGGVTSVHCQNNCTITDSFLHGQMIGAKDVWHLGGFHTNGGSNYTLTHNSIFCEVPANSVGEGCSGDVVLNSTFGPTAQAKVKDNFMGASTGLAFCTYTGTNTNSYVVYTGNVFARGTNGKCGAYGAVSDWANATGNVWTGNVWDDGSALSSNS